MKISDPEEKRYSIIEILESKIYYTYFLLNKKITYFIGKEMSRTGKREWKDVVSFLCIKRKKILIRGQMNAVHFYLLLCTLYTFHTDCKTAPPTLHSLFIYTPHILENGFLLVILSKIS